MAFTTQDVEQAIQIIFNQVGGVADGDLRVRSRVGL
jgi:hypothetical protein